MVHEVALPVENVLIAHGVHTPLETALENVPAGHGEHTSPEVLPIPSGQRVHEVDAPAAAVIPAGQL